MKVRKNLEAVFLATAALATFASYATADVPAFHATKAAQAAPVIAAPMQVVVIKGQRLSAAEKAQLK
jgi:drug/metabolite transporter (DMT)-like permease